MAGGAGTRLWPLSRESQPKPLIPLVDQSLSMFQVSVERLSPLFPPERILVVANSDLTASLREQAPSLPAENFIIEPEGRDTAPAVGLGAIHIGHRDPQAVMAVLTADHHIKDVGKFHQVLEIASRVAASGAIVTLGITPTFPATGFGYIERGRLDRSVDGVEVFALKQFHEKPDQHTAEQYLLSGNFSWNSGMFTWTVQRVMAEFRRHAPDIYSVLARLEATIGRPDYDEVLAQVWPEVRRISVDFALMEHIREDVYVIPVELGWSDIGNFSALYNVLSSGNHENVIHASETPLLLDTTGTLIISKRLVAAIGIENLIIVDTGDSLLVCRRDRAQDVRQIVEQLKREQRNTYL